MKEKKITETITLYRLNFSLIVIAIFGIIGWLLESMKDRKHTATFI